MVSTEYHRRRNGDFDWSQWKYTLEKVWLQLLLVYTWLFSCDFLCTSMQCRSLPLQTNSYDCGVLVCQYAKHLLYSSQLTQVCLLGLS